MAYADIPTLKRAIVDQLAAIMPDCPVTNKPVPVDYAYPGQKNQRPTHVWMFNARCLSEYGSMGAGTKRRDQLWTLQLVVEHFRDARAVDGSGSNELQQQIEAVVVEISGLIDQWVATHPTLGQNTPGSVPVDHATFAAFALEQGEHATGAAARGTVDITVRIRPK
jgi:hypothetical protein